MLKIKRLSPGNEELARDVVNHVKNEESPDSNTVDAVFMKEFLACKSNYLVVGYEGSTPVGFALGYKLPRVDGKKAMMYLHELGVVECRRGKGIGTRLVDEMVKICKSEGFMEMFVISGWKNLPAVKVYEATGGRPIKDSDVVFCYDFDDSQP